MNLALDTNMVNSDIVSHEEGPPYPLLAAWRAQDPVHWNPAPAPGAYQAKQPGMKMEKGFWMLTRYDDVAAVSRDAETFATHTEGFVIWDYEAEALRQMQSNMMAMPPRAHLQIKKMLQSPFMPRSLNVFLPEIRQVARDLVNEVIEQGECEFVFDIAAKLPVYTFCKLTGIPDSDRETVSQLGNKAADFETPPGEQGAAKQQLLAIAKKVIDEKRRQPPDGSMMSALLQGELDSEPLTDEQIGMFFFVMSVAGHETTRATSAHFVNLMNQHPDQYELLRSDIDKYLPNAIEEVLRFAPPVMNFRRTATKEVVVGGHQFHSGDKICMYYPAANRDPAMFADPDRFDITRQNANRHLSFGIGIHMCLGARLARTQLFELLKVVVQRMPDIRPTENPTFLPSIMFNAIIKMPVAFTPGARLS